MASGFIIYDEDGKVMLDYTSPSSTIKNVIAATAGVNGSVAYPDLIGKQIRVTTLSSTLVFDYRNSLGSIKAVRCGTAITYPGGVPTLTWTYTRGLASDVFIDTTLVVFAK